LDLTIVRRMGSIARLFGRTILPDRGRDTVADVGQRLGREHTTEAFFFPKCASVHTPAAGMAL
jgi:hypothetical protein